MLTDGARLSETALWNQRSPGLSTSKHETFHLDSDAPMKSHRRRTGLTCTVYTGLFRLLFLSIISTAYHLLSGSRAARLLLTWLIEWLIDDCEQFKGEDQLVAVGVCVPAFNSRMTMCRRKLKSSIWSSVDICCRCSGSEGCESMFQLGRRSVVRDSVLWLPTRHRRRPGSSRSSARGHVTQWPLRCSGYRLPRWRHWSLQLVSLPSPQTLCPLGASFRRHWSAALC